LAWFGLGLDLGTLGGWFGLVWLGFGLVVGPLASLATGILALASVLLKVTIF
jgi:hypothetical protein